MDPPRRSPRAPLPDSPPVSPRTAAATKRSGDLAAGAPAKRPASPRGGSAAGFAAAGGGGGGAPAPARIASGVAVAPAWAHPAPAHGVIALGTAAAAVALFTAPVFVAVVGVLVAAGWLAVQGRSAGGGAGYAVLQKPAGEAGEAFRTLRERVPEWGSVMDAAARDVAAALRVAFEDVKWRFVKLDSGGSPVGALPRGARLTGKHVVHMDVDALGNVRVCVSFFFVDEGVAWAPLTFRAGSTRAGALASEHVSQLNHGAASGQLPATGFHGVDGLQRGVCRMLLVADVDVSRWLDASSASVAFTPAPRAFDDVAPVVVPAGTAARLAAAIACGFQSRKSVQAAWRGWLAGRKYCALLRAEELGVLTAERAAALYVWREAKRASATSAYEEQLVQLDIDLAEARSSGFAAAVVAAEQACDAAVLQRAKLLVRKALGLVEGNKVVDSGASLVALVAAASAGFSALGACSAGRARAPAASLGAFSGYIERCGTGGAAAADAARARAHAPSPPRPALPSSPRRRHQGR